jgi:hypothetical protein
MKVWLHKRYRHCEEERRSNLLINEKNIHGPNNIATMKHPLRRSLVLDNNIEQ